MTTNGRAEVSPSATKADEEKANSYTDLTEEAQRYLAESLVAISNAEKIDSEDENAYREATYHIRQALQFLEVVRDQDSQKDPEVDRLLTGGGGWR